MPHGGKLIFAGSHWHSSVRQSMLYRRLLPVVASYVDIPSEPVRTSLTQWGTNHVLAQYARQMYGTSLICNATRPNQPAACRRWAFSRNDLFAALGFIHATTADVGVYFGGKLNWEHLQWFLAYESLSGYQYATAQYTSSMPDVYDLETSRMDVIVTNPIVTNSSL